MTASANAVTASIPLAVVNMFVCPSDGNSPGKGADGGNTAFQGNYALNAGPGAYTVNNAVSPPVITVTDPTMISTTDRGGLFYYNSKTGLRNCTDGTSNTLLASEGIIRGNGASAWGELGGYWGGAPHGAFGFSTSQVPNTSVPDRVDSCKATSLPGAPNQAPCENGNAGGLAGRYNFARSYHTGGVQAALADGSVMFFSINIDRQTWLKLGIYNDGMPVGEF